MTKPYIFIFLFVCKLHGMEVQEVIGLMHQQFGNFCNKRCTQIEKRNKFLSYLLKEIFLVKNRLEDNYNYDKDLIDLELQEGMLNKVILLNTQINLFIQNNSWLNEREIEAFNKANNNLINFINIYISSFYENQTI